MKGVFVVRNLYDVIATSAAVKGTVTFRMENGTQVWMNHSNSSNVHVNKGSYYRYCREHMTKGSLKAANHTQVDDVISSMELHANARLKKLKRILIPFYSSSLFV